ncbi:MAG: HDOD domain-containing protein [Syntrophales bacterium LBB04]|nr:HDOD domain-containing protein [Syntrophales bacterium LBB04]
MIDKILRSIEHIPAFPFTIMKVSEILRDDDYSVNEVVNLIKYDPAMAANVIKMSNSAYLAARHRISTVRDAVVYLGRNNLVRLVQTAGISRFYNKVGRGYVATANELWEHAVAVAIMSQILSRKVMKREDETLYLAALLHDVGKAVMGEFVYESLEKIMALIATGRYSFLEAEEAVIGINHAALGGRIAAYWHFPKKIENALAYHHRPDFLEEDDDNTTWLVYLADQICLIMGISGGMDDLAHRGLNEVMKKFDFHEKDLEMGMIQLVDDLKRAKDLISIV